MLPEVTICIPVPLLAGSALCKIGWKRLNQRVTFAFVADFLAFKRSVVLGGGAVPLFTRGFLSVNVHWHVEVFFASSADVTKAELKRRFPPWTVVYLLCFWYFSTVKHLWRYVSYVTEDGGFWKRLARLVCPTTRNSVILRMVLIVSSSNTKKMRLGFALFFILSLF